VSQPRDTPPPSAGAGAGIYLLTALILCVCLGLGAGWLVGSPVLGAVAGGAIGVPVSFLAVYLKYRNL
jgi:hypothetical protein